MDLDSILDGALDDLEASSWQAVPSSVDSTKQHNETGAEQQQQQQPLQKKDKRDQQQQQQQKGKANENDNGEDEIPIIEVNTSNTNDGNSSKKSDELFVGGGSKHTTKTNKASSSGGDMIDEAVATVNASVKEAQTHKIASGEDEMKEFFNTLFSSFNEDTTDEQLEANLKKMMGTFFNADSLKEPIQTIAEKYPRWLEANREKLEPKELENHEKQCELYLQVWQKLDNKNNKNNKSHKKSNNNNENANMEEIMDLLTKTFAYGSLPSEVMDGMMPTELKQFADQMLRLEKELEKEEEHKNTDANNDNSTGGDSGSSKSNKKKDDNNSSNAESDDAAYMKLFEQMMSGVNDPNAPDLKDMPKLSPEEMKNMQQLMKSDCLLM